MLSEVPVHVIKTHFVCCQADENVADHAVQRWESPDGRNRMNQFNQPIVTDQRKGDTDDDLIEQHLSHNLYDKRHVS